MKPLLVIICLLLFEYTFYAQARVVLNNNGYVVFSNSSYLVLDNGNSNALATSGTGGNIISEGEYNRVKWAVGTNTGTYTLPFTKSAGNKIPLSVTISTAGIGTGNILFSTYGGANWDNSTYLPSDVTNISSLTGGLNNSAHVIDRFWIVDAQGYMTKPGSMMNFTYLDAEWSAAGNSISESGLFAQRFNSGINDWGGWLGANGTANVAANTVSTGSIPPADFYRSWTLVDASFALPVELLYFKADCGENGDRNFVWATATEKNNLFFGIEGSVDAITWHELSRVNGSGQSEVTHVYTSNVSSTPHNYKYFRLKQTDNDGSYKYSDIIYNDCEGFINRDISVYPSPNNGTFTLFFSGYENEVVTIKITNSLGELLEEYSSMMTSKNDKESISLKEKANGVYFVSVKAGDKSITKKIIVNP